MSNQNKINFIWIDKNNQINNERYLPTLEKLFPNKFSVQFLPNLKSGIEKLKSINFQHCYVIVSGGFFEGYVEIMKEEGKKLKCVPNVFIFTSDYTRKALNEGKINERGGIKKIETLNYVKDDFFNKGGVFSGINSMTERINQLNDLLNNSSDYNNIFENKTISNKDSNQKMYTFKIKSKEDLIFPYVYNQFISYEEKDKEKIKKFLYDLMKEKYYEKTKYRITYVNDLIKPLINLFDAKYFPEEILIKYLVYIYSLQTGFYKDLNIYLSTHENQGIYETFISLMYRGIYLDVFAKDKKYSEFTLYRAQLMNKEEVSRIKNLYEKKNDSLPSEILFSNSFLSFTYNEKVYHKFFKENKEFINILFVIEKGVDLDFTCHADLDEVSKYYEDEKEILFFPFSCFTIEDIDENYKDYMLKDEKKKEIVVTKIKLNYLGKYKKEIKEAIKTINIDEFKLNLKNNDFYNKSINFNMTENKDKIKEKLDKKINNIIGTMKSSIINEEYINELKKNLLSNVILIKSNKLIENNKNNFYAYSDKKNDIISLIIQNKDLKNQIINNSILNNDGINNYIITDEYSKSMINYIYELKDGRILLCCFDNQIKIITKNYAYNKFYFEQRLKNHKNLITNIIELSNGKLCSCSFDGTIKLWKKNDSNHYSQDDNLFIDTELIFYTIIEVNNNIVSLLKNYKNENKYLAIYSIDNKKEEFKKNINEIELYNKNLININNGTFAFGGTNKIYVFNLKGQKIVELNLNFSVVCLYKLKDNSYIVSSNDGKLFLATDLKFFDSFNIINYSDKDNMINKIISIEQFEDNTIISRSKTKIFIWKMK